MRVVNHLLSIFAMLLTLGGSLALCVCVYRMPAQLPSAVQIW